MVALLTDLTDVSRMTFCPLISLSIELSRFISNFNTVFCKM